MQKIAIITGGNRGIGFGVAQKLAEEGWSLAICATRTESECRDALDSLRAFGNEAFYCQMNVSETSSRNDGVKKIVDHFGKINLLVNNAGVAPLERRDLLETTEESYERVMRINLHGPFFLTQTVANLMVEMRKANPDEPASIVNVSSISATVASVNRGEYCISKAGVSMATQLWAVRLAEFGIPVYEIRPGIIHSDMTETVRAKYDKLIAEGLIPQARWGTPEDVGRAVATLARGDLLYSTGQVILVDGGQTLARL